MSVLALQATEIFLFVIALKGLFTTLASKERLLKENIFFPPGKFLLHLWGNETCKVVARTIAWCNSFSKMPSTFSICSYIKRRDIFMLGMKSWRQNKKNTAKPLLSVSCGKFVCFVVFLTNRESHCVFTYKTPYG